MAHALAAFIVKRMDERKLRNRDIVRDSGLSRALVSRYVNDKREALSRLPERETLEGLAKAFHVSPDFLFGKAVEALGIGYTSGDFVNSVATATDRELLDEIAVRLLKRGEDQAGSDFVTEPVPLTSYPIAARSGLSDEERRRAEEAYREAAHPTDDDTPPSAGGSSDESGASA